MTHEEPEHGTPFPADLWIHPVVFAGWFPHYAQDVDRPLSGSRCQGHLLTGLVLFRLAVDETGDLPRVCVLQGGRPKLLGEVLVGHRAEEAVDC